MLCEWCGKSIDWMRIGLSLNLLNCVKNLNLISTLSSLEDDSPINFKILKMIELWWGFGISAILQLSFYVQRETVRKWDWRYWTQRYVCSVKNSFCGVHSPSRCVCHTILGVWREIFHTWTVYQGPNKHIQSYQLHLSAYSAGEHKPLMIKAQYRTEILLTKIRSQQS